MNSIKDHYDNLLAANYVWAFGEHEDNAAKFKALVSQYQITPRAGACAVDLGCGPGYQSIALADLGFHVLAVDIIPALLHELRHRLQNRDITIIEDDLMHFNKHCSDKAVDFVICLGDVISHLPTLPHTAKLFTNVFQTLMPGGKFLVSFRDQEITLTGTDRILPFYSDENKIMTTFLEYTDDFVDVTDIIYERTGSTWTLEKSQYRKLRFRTGQVKALLTESGFEIDHCHDVGGLITILATKK